MKTDLKFRLHEGPELPYLSLAVEDAIEDINPDEADNLDIIHEALVEYIGEDLPCPDVDFELYTWDLEQTRQYLAAKHQAQETTNYHGPLVLYVPVEI